MVFWEGFFSSKQSYLYGENICLVESWKDEDMQDGQQRHHFIYKGEHQVVNSNKIKKMKQIWQIPTLNLFSYPTF